MAGVVDDGQRRRQVNENDRYTLRRYDEFRAAAEYVATAFAAVPAVIRVALFGSVASSARIEATRRRRSLIHEPKDVDLAVWLDGPADFDRLRVLCGRAVNQLWQEKEMGVAHHQVDVFLLDMTGKYLGRLCHFNQCPKHKLLTDCPVRRDRECESRLVAVAGRGRVLDQANVIREDVPRHRPRRVLIAHVLIVDTERDAGADGHVTEHDLVPVGRDGI